MAGKARVHELAKELGVTSKEVLARLNEQGEFVKSASSTVEAPVARRLRESFGGSKPAPDKSTDKAPDAAKGKSADKSLDTALDKAIDKAVGNGEAAKDSPRRDNRATGPGRRGTRAADSKRPAWSRRRPGKRPAIRLPIPA